MEKQTPLYDRHLKAQAKMVPFAGFSMPVQYSGIREEHKAVREKAGLFDVSHMGNILVTGVDALANLQQLCVNDVSKLSPLEVQYSAMCYENGTVVDDILITFLEPNAYHVVVNASNIEKDYNWMLSKKFGEVEFINQSESLCILALQGPKALGIAQKIAEDDLSGLKPFSCGTGKINGINMVYSRTGYTGEDGLEFFPKNKDAPELWDKLLEAGKEEGLLPVGLGARDTLRLEAGYTLYGHEVNESCNLVEGGLSWIVAWDKPDFIGKAALAQIKENGPERKIVGLEMLDKAIPREGYVIEKNGESIGKITSGTMSPNLEKGIALAYLKNEFAKSGEEVDVMIRDSAKKAKVVSRYFYKRRKETSAS